MRFNYAHINAHMYTYNIRDLMFTDVCFLHGIIILFNNFEKIPFTAGNQVIWVVQSVIQTKKHYLLSND